MKDYSKQYLIDNIYILVDKDYQQYKEYKLNKYLIIDFNENDVWLLSNFGLVNKYRNYKNIEWIPNDLKIGKQFQKIEVIFYNDDYTQNMYCYTIINIPIIDYFIPLRKYYHSKQCKRTIDICAVLISEGDFSHLIDIKNLPNIDNSLSSFLTEH